MISAHPSTATAVGLNVWAARQTDSLSSTINKPVIEVLSTPCPSSSIAFANFFPVFAQTLKACRCSFHALNSSSISLTFRNVSSCIDCVPLPKPGPIPERSSGDCDLDDVIDVALFVFGMASDALDGEWVPKNGIVDDQYKVE